MAKEKYEEYGGEGRDYQINPRIGLAYLHNNRVDEAREIFKKQIDEDLPIGNLYADYGLALITYRSGNKEEANRKLDDIEREIGKKTSSYVLLKLIKAFREQQAQAKAPVSAL